jgi:hypothetical protein
MYYTNPMVLNTSFDISVNDEILQHADKTNSLHTFFLTNLHYFSFFHHHLNFSSIEINYLLDFKKEYSFLFNINWLTLDTPFCVNPYLVKSYSNLNFEKFQLTDFYKFNSLYFSSFSSLQESFNFNLFFDWSTGAYLDIINLISYVSTF